MTLTFRKAVPGDEALVADFVRALAEYENLAHEAVATPEDFGRTLFGPTPHGHALFVEIGGEPVAFAVWFFNYSTFTGRPGLFVEDIFVKPEHRGRGLGTAIFRELARRAVDEGCGRMEWLVLNDNAPAVKFYRGIGARPMDQWTVQRLDGETLASLAAGGE